MFDYREAIKRISLNLGTFAQKGRGGSIDVFIYLKRK
jgi:hypothetical protein